MSFIKRMNEDYLMGTKPYPKTKTSVVGKSTRVDTQIEGSVITSEELHRKANQWAKMVMGVAKSNTSAFTKGKTKDKHVYGEKRKRRREYAEKRGEKMTFSLRNFSQTSLTVVYRRASSLVKSGFHPVANLIFNAITILLACNRASFRYL